MEIKSRFDHFNINVTDLAKSLEFYGKALGLKETGRKEGFLRSETSLVQTIGRAARNAQGKVIMYADTVTESMEKAITETYRRREIQKKYNEDHGIVPKSIHKEIRDILEISTNEKGEKKHKARTMSQKEREATIAKLTAEMKNAAQLLEFEHAAYLRDKIKKLKEQK